MHRKVDKEDSTEINNLNIVKQGNRTKEDRFSLIVRDNGKGFPEDLDFLNTDSLGLQLVTTLVDQIEGDI